MLQRVVSSLEGVGSSVLMHWAISPAPLVLKPLIPTLYLFPSKGRCPCVEAGATSVKPYAEAPLFNSPLCSLCTGKLGKTGPSVSQGKGTNDFTTGPFISALRKIAGQTSREGSAIG